MEPSMDDARMPAAEFKARCLQLPDRVAASGEPRAVDWMRAAPALPGIRTAPLEPEIAIAITRLPGELHADPAGRLIVATARHLGAVLVTADAALLAYGRQGHQGVLMPE